MNVLYNLRFMLIIIIRIFWFYQIFLSLFSLMNIKNKKLIINKDHKFMCIIPAYNEENVISNLIESLKSQNYPKNLFDIYVIADNCTDKTKEISKNLGVTVYERFDPHKKTKGYALNWFFKEIMEKNLDYDAFLVFDSDNIVDENFIKNMNLSLCKGEEIVQGYRDIKNPTDSWVTAGYSMFYWTLNKLYHLARYNIGLSPLINGTGFMVKFDIIKQDGFNTKTMTEDIEFSLQNIIKGRKLGWCKDAILYDEQPIKFMPSYKQRVRWTVGHIECLKFYYLDLIKSSFKNKTFIGIDGFLYLLGIPMFILKLIVFLMNLFLFSIGRMYLGEFLIHFYMFLMASFIIPTLIGVIVMVLERKPIKQMIKGILCYPIFLASWVIISVRCLIIQDTKWEKIDHSRNIKISDIKK